MFSFTIARRGAGSLSSSLVHLEKPSYTFSPYRPQPRWNALRELRVPFPKTANDDVGLDGTLDRAGYQLFRDGLLQEQPIRGMVTHRSDYGEVPPAVRRKLEKERLSAESMMKKHGVSIRRSIKDTAIVIGSDEAGRGPLAGPVFSAAMCRIPLSSFNNDLQALYDTQEPFGVYDSKGISDKQRHSVMKNTTGFDSFFQIAEAKNFTVHHANDDPAPDSSLTSKTFPSHAKLSKLSFRKLLSTPTPYLVSYHGHHSDDAYLYIWAIGFANHSYIDKYNIYLASMRAIHRCSLVVWRMLNDTRFSYEKAPRPRHSSIAQYLFTRFCVLACHDDDVNYVPPNVINLDSSASEFLDFEPVQPPLILVDGHGVPEESQLFFTDIQVGGSTQPVIDGDRRSYSIAAASSLAKVARDEVMDYLHTLYPVYQFNENRGYPVEHHMKMVDRHGVSAVHRRSYKPCINAIEKADKKSKKGKAAAASSSTGSTASSPKK